MPIFDPEPILAGLPHLPGVYRMLAADGAALYVGKARDLKRRVSSYFRKTDSSPRIRLMLTQVADLQTTVVRSESEALLLENNLIKELRPRYNILFRDDKSYPYLMLSGHDYPRLAFYRGVRDKANRYFGPYPNSLAVRDSIQILQKVFQIRSCEDSVYAHRSRPCLLHQIHRCSAPCVGFVTAEVYAQSIEDAALLLSGRDGELLSRLEKAMLAASERLDFEQAAALRDQMLALNRVREKQFVESHTQSDVDVLGVATHGGLVCIYLMMIRGGRNLGGRSFFPGNATGAEPAAVLDAFVAQHYAGLSALPEMVLAEDIDSVAWLRGTEGHPVRVTVRPTGSKRVWLRMAEQNAQLAAQAREGQEAGQAERLSALNEALGVDGIARIECFDVSHTQGEATVASCVVYDQGTMQNAQYRRYNLSPPAPGDDYAGLREALLRRFSNQEADGQWPDLLLVDGGRGQVNVAQGVLNELGISGFLMLGVAKGEARKPGLEQLIWPDEAEPLRLPADHPGLHLIQQVRDEAHRFAITGHRARRSKARTRSSVEGIAGVGPKRRQRLLQAFGGLRGLQSAGIEEIAQVEGISRALAERIYRELHG